MIFSLIKSFQATWAERKGLQMLRVSINNTEKRVTIVKHCILGQKIHANTTTYFNIELPLNVKIKEC